MGFIGLIAAVKAISVPFPASSSPIYDSQHSPQVA
jgi:hypothetical protein